MQCGSSGKITSSGRIIAATADLPDKAAATDRLLQNQVDIGNAIKPYYGDAAGNQLTTLLKEHITTAGEIVTAAKAGDKAKQDDATKRWFTNADQIADFFKQSKSEGVAAGGNAQDDARSFESND